VARRYLEVDDGTFWTGKHIKQFPQLITTMRRVRFRDESGNAREGEWVDDAIRFGGKEYDPESVDVLPPVEPSKIVGVGLNYRDHVEETGSDVPEIPRLFLMPPNTLTGHGEPVTVPPGKDRIEPEGELGVVIGRQCRNVPKSDAEDVVDGYTCVNDLSNRDDQLDQERTGRADMVRGKAFDNAAPIGPVIATPDEVPEDARIESRINGELVQEIRRNKQIFDVAELVSEISSYMTLEVGDVISTGTPLGPTPLSDSDTVSITIEGIGTLENTIHVPE
jgi:2-keto-4-pentenoate hydratase/2-oxohepta-3-ene-1,7-dioic acid hydratase in catechol pathway